MVRKPVVLPAARADILERFEYLVEHDAVQAADRFLEAVDKAIERIVEMPGLGAPVAIENLRLQGLRSWPVPGFEAVRIYYLPTEDSTRVVRVLHGMMDLPPMLESARAD